MNTKMMMVCKCCADFEQKTRKLMLINQRSGLKLYSKFNSSHRKDEQLLFKAVALMSNLRLYRFFSLMFDVPKAYDRRKKKWIDIGIMSQLVTERKKLEIFYTVNNLKPFNPYVNSIYVQICWMYAWIYRFQHIFHLNVYELRLKRFEFMQFWRLASI